MRLTNCVKALNVNCRIPGHPENGSYPAAGRSTVTLGQEFRAFSILLKEEVKNSNVPLNCCWKLTLAQQQSVLSEHAERVLSAGSEKTG